MCFAQLDLDHTKKKSYWINLKRSTETKNIKALTFHANLYIIEMKIPTEKSVSLCKERHPPFVNEKQEKKTDCMVPTLVRSDFIVYCILG